MKIDAKVVLLDGALHGLREWSDSNHLILHTDQSLVAVEWSALRETRERVAVVFGSHGLGRVIATKVTVDNAWTVDPTSRLLLLARDGKIEYFDPSSGDSVRTVALAGLPSGTFAAALDSASQRLLLVVMNVVNLDFAEYGVVAADLANGHLTREPGIRSKNDLELLWDGRYRAWVICDTGTATLWRWDGQKPAIKLTGMVPNAIQHATIVDSDDGIIAGAIVSHSSAATALAWGHVDQDRVIWSSPVSLSGPAVLVAKKNFKDPLWACLAQQGWQQQIQIRDASAVVLDSTNLAPRAHLSDLLWSRYGHGRFWGFGVHSLLAANLGG